MRTLDLTPLLRSSVGFDHINRLMDSALSRNEASYPPYNIEKISEDDYRITIALAGFSEDDLDVTINDGVLIVSAKSIPEQDEEEGRYLYRGIAQRAFERQFRLADTIRVMGARLDHGLLTIDLKREVPEHLKPRTVPINDGNKKPKTLKSQTA